jgi:hypothetical protein
VLAHVPAARRGDIDRLIHAATASGLDGALAAAAVLGLIGAIVAVVALRRVAPPAPAPAAPAPGRDRLVVAAAESVAIVPDGGAGVTKGPRHGAQDEHPAR